MDRDALPLPSIPAAHRRTAGRQAARTALRWKEAGWWRGMSWEEYRDRADAAAAGLIGLGLAPGDRVAILSENRPEWLLADIAILSAGAIDVPLHAALAAEQVGFQMAHAGARGAIVSTATQAAKVAAVAGALPELAWVVLLDGGGRVAGRRTVSWDDLRLSGRTIGGDWRERVLERESRLRRDDPATILYTSGTTGEPKGVVLTHGNLLADAAAAALLATSHPDDLTLCWLPLSHVYARTCDHVMAILAGHAVAFAESPEQVVANIAETEPTRLNAVPRFYQKLWATLEALPAEERPARLRALVGPRMRELHSGGAALPATIAAGFREAGIPILQGYGLTETSPVITTSSLAAHRDGTVGRPIPGVEVRVAPDGEVLTRGPHVMRGYWRDEAATRAVIDAEGWLATGDVGEIDADGYLRITDRTKDIIVTSTGRSIAPAALEALLVADSWIEQALVCGEGRPYVAALVVPVAAVVHDLAERLGCGIEIDGERIVSPAIVAAFARRVEEAMKPVGAGERVRAFALLSRPFDVSRGEMTSTHKIRRRIVLEGFAATVEAIYGRAAGAEDC